MTDFLSTVLGNGLQVVAQPLPGVQSVAYGFFVGAGARDEHWGLAGLSHLTESTMFRGTENLSSRELTDRLDRLGVSRGSNAGIEVSVFSALQLGEHLLDSLELVGDVLRRPAFPKDELESVRALQVQEIGQREDQPAQLVMDQARQVFFAGSSLANDVLGTVESVSSLTREHVVDYWSSRYTPNDMVLAIAGSFDWQKVVDKLEDTFAGWTEGVGRLAQQEPAINRTVRVHEQPTAQENICMTFPAVAYGDRHYYAASLVSIVLGGGMNSRLFTEIREKRGLAYSVGSRFDGMEMTGLFRVYVGTQPDRAQESVDVLFQELRRLNAAGITEDELDRAKTRLKSSLVMNSENTGNRAMAVGRDWWFKQRFRTLREVREQIDEVSVAAVREFLDRIRLTNNIGVVALGPVSARDLGLGQAHFAVVANGQEG